MMSFSLGQPSPAPCPPAPVYPSLATVLGRELLLQKAKLSFSSHFQRLRDTLCPETSEEVLLACSIPMGTHLSWLPVCWHRWTTHLSLTPSRISAFPH